MTIALTDVAIAVLSTTLALSPFYLFAGMGEIVSEKSGVANMGLEGIMLMSLVITFIVDYVTGNPWVALFAAIGIAGVMGAVFAFFAIQVRLDQIALGLAIYLFGLGFSLIVFNIAYPSGLLQARVQFRYCWSLTCSIQSTTLPFSASWMAICVIAVVGAAPCQCFSPGGNQTTSPGRISSLGPPHRCAQPRPDVTIKV